MNIMRKTRFRKWTMVMVCAFWLMGALPQNAVAADMVAATISPDITIWIDGAERSFFSADGQQVYPLLCQDTVYLPLRSIGELMNKNVSWDQSALTVSISGTRTAAPVEGTRDVDAVKQTIHKRNQRSVCRRIVDGASDHQTVARFKFRGRLIDQIIKDTFSFFCTCAAGHTTADCLVSHMYDFRLDALLLKNGFHLV